MDISDHQLHLPMFVNGNLGIEISTLIGSEQRAIVEASVTRKKSPNVYKSCPKMISLEK